MKHPKEASPSRAGAAEPGTLYLVSTPIGNLGDCSHRVQRILESVDGIACEDTRVTGKLLAHLGLKKNCRSYREENEQAMTPVLLEELQAGRSLALVADAGTPTLSDPGFRLVRACRNAGLPVSPIPGPFAGVAALAASGLPTNGFLFVGFLPPKKAARQRFFKEYQKFPYTLVFYESTHRIEKFMEDALVVFGPDRALCIAREITKIHETFLTGPLHEVKAALALRSQKGEFVVCIANDGFIMQ